jgi:5-methylcytosine-specific restriction endonuclease McrBC regulatory subunit McrC
MRRNIPFQGRIAYNTHEYTRNNPLMQLVRHTIECIDQRKTGRDILRSDVETREAVDVVRNYTTYIPNDRQQIISANQRPVAHPYYFAYRDLQNICLKILRYERVSYGDNKETVYGILFDGAWLWEEYVNTMLRTMGFTHPKNKNHIGAIKLFADESEFYYNMYPDFYSDDYKCVLDAKYKHLENGVQREDLYQVISYMHTMKYPHGGYLYPYCPQDYEDNDDVEKTIKEKQTYILANDTGTLITVPFNVPQKCDSWKVYCEQMKKEEDNFKGKIYDIRK